MRRLALAATLASLAVPAIAQRADPAWVDRLFAQSDRNRDGQLSRGEVTRAVNQAHRERRLTTGESRIQTNFWFNRLDGDHNNAITRREARAAAREYQARFDRNRNGRIDPRERPALDAFLRNPSR